MDGAFKALIDNYHIMILRAFFLEMLYEHLTILVIIILENPNITNC